MPVGKGLARSLEAVRPSCVLLAGTACGLPPWGRSNPTSTSAFLLMPNFHPVGDHDSLVVTHGLDGPDGKTSVAQFLARFLQGIVKFALQRGRSFGRCNRSRVHAVHLCLSGLGNEFNGRSAAGHPD